MKRFLRGVADRGLPDELADPLYVIAINRSDLVSAELLPRVEAELKQQPSASRERLIENMADAIAYGGDERSLDTLLHLAEIDTSRFAPTIPLLLRYTFGRDVTGQNSFSLAYYAFGKTNQVVDQAILRWVEDYGSTHNGVRYWAEAIVKLNKGRPSEEKLLTDPIISRLPGGIPSDLRVELQNVSR
ncbi:MAG: hypothetical protein HY650_10825 [Acidobacteria bacterium]|nr:hypothetical protein [Acidobacteriota bacterium]